MVTGDAGNRCAFGEATAETIRIRPDNLESNAELISSSPNQPSRKPFSSKKVKQINKEPDALFGVCFTSYLNLPMLHNLTNRNI